MEHFPEFVINHPFLFGGAALALTFTLVAEFRARRGPKPLSTGEAVLLMNHQNAVVLDVREANEYSAGHILNAINVPFSALKERMPQLDKYKDKPIIVCCKGGTQGLTAAAQLKDAGFTQARYLKNGVFAWTTDNLPLEK
ncbi:MAG: rhodanese-like domain-containing protein [Gammaproteobacteria bacterium]|nr:rhodanese-like domain-containing protein [Gammaproteobacteria bacterium]